MINYERLKLMSVMLGEVIAGEWKPTAPDIPTIRSVPVENNIRFELHSWFGLTSDYCGYSACAIGHACFDERFNKEGLVFGDSGPALRGSAYHPWYAIQEFFGINYDLALHLFSDHSYFEISQLVEWQRDGSRPPVTPDRVKARIDEVIGWNA